MAGMKKLGRHYGLRKPAKLARFGEQGYGLVYWGWTGIYGVVSALVSCGDIERLTFNSISCPNSQLGGTAPKTSG